jgi:DNA replication licensing factor MCM6
MSTLEDDEPADAGKKKLVITEEHFQRVTQALVMKLRQHEESVKKDGTNTYLCS